MVKESLKSMQTGAIKYLGAISGSPSKSSAPIIQSPKQFGHMGPPGFPTDPGRMPPIILRAELNWKVIKSERKPMFSPPKNAYKSRLIKGCLKKKRMYDISNCQY